MDYMGLLRRAWYLTWRQRGLWWLGLLAAVTSSGSIFIFIGTYLTPYTEREWMTIHDGGTRGSNIPWIRPFALQKNAFLLTVHQPLEGTTVTASYFAIAGHGERFVYEAESGETLSSYVPIPTDLANEIAVYFSTFDRGMEEHLERAGRLFVLLLILLTIPGLKARADLIRAVAKSESETPGPVKPVTLRLAGRLLLMKVILYVPATFILASITPGGSVIALMIFTPIALVLFCFILLIDALAVRTIVLDERFSIFEAIQRGWQLLDKNFILGVQLSVSCLIINGLFNLLLSFLLVPLSWPMTALIDTTPVQRLFISWLEHAAWNRPLPLGDLVLPVVVYIGVLMVMALFRFWVVAFQSAVFTLAYLKFEDKVRTIEGVATTMPQTG
jgi:hypothetical protein